MPAGSRKASRISTLPKPIRASPSGGQRPPCTRLYLLLCGRPGSMPKPGRPASVKWNDNRAAGS